MNVQQLIDKLESRRALAANEAVIFETSTGKALARGRAYAYNQALKLVYQLDGAPKEPKSPIDDEFKEGGQY